MKPNWHTISTVLISVLLTLQVRSWFTPAPVNADLIRAREEVKRVEEKRLADSVVFEIRLAMYDSLIAASRDRSAGYANGYQTVKKQYEKIPAVVADYDRDRLRRAFTEFR